MSETVKSAHSRGGQLRMQLPDAAEHLARIQVGGQGGRRQAAAGEMP
jgi:hypothetical protein